MSEKNFSFYRVNIPDRPVEDARRLSEWPGRLDGFSPVTASIREFQELLVHAPRDDIDAIRLEGIMIGLQIAQSRNDVAGIVLADVEGEDYAE